MDFLYHRFNWRNVSSNGKIKFTDDFGNTIRLYKRNFNNQGAYFYMYSHVFPTLFIYSGDFIGQLYDYCQKVKSKCTSKSIKSAFSECPNLRKIIDNEGFDNCHIEDVSIHGKTKKCLAVCYPSFLFTKKRMFTSLVNMEETLKDEVNKIKKYELKGKWDNLKKIGAGALKVAAKVGVAMVAGAIGANLDFDLPDFDFGFSLPDLDFDADIDLDADVDFDTDFDTGSLYPGGDDALGFNDVDGNGYNVSFQSQNAVLHTPGDGQNLEVTITKESGSSNLFTISSNKGTVHHVSGTDSSVKINGIKYLLPKLKG